MEPLTLLALCALLALAAALYTSVGHAGASAYLAVTALFSVAPEVMRPTALTLNVLVASYAAWRYIRAGQFDGRLLLPLVAGAVPFAFLGGGIQLPGHWYRPMVGAILLIAAVRLLWPAPLARQQAIARPPIWAGVATGAAIGLLSGLTGTGGGIFLSPIVLFLGWAEPRKTSGVAVTFILFNSLAGLAGNLASVGRLPGELPYMLVAVMLGALVGTRFGVSLFKVPRLLQALGLVLVIAGFKLIFT